MVRTPDDDCFLFMYPWVRAIKKPFFFFFQRKTGGVLFLQLRAEILAFLFQLLQWDSSVSHLRVRACATRRKVLPAIPILKLKEENSEWKAEKGDSVTVNTVQKKRGREQWFHPQCTSSGPEVKLGSNPQVYLSKQSWSPRSPGQGYPIYKWPITVSSGMWSKKV